VAVEVQVAAAAIVGPDGRLLISRRLEHQHQGGLWEFPGGKVEAGETVTEALKRELREELGIGVTHCAPLIQIPFAYPDKRVLLDVWCVTAFDGIPVGLEGQPLRWVTRDELDPADFPPANRPIIAALQLPDHYAISGAFTSAADLERRVRALLARGVPMLQLRMPDAAASDLIATAAWLHPLCRSQGTRLIVNGDPRQLAGASADGVHLNRHRLRALGAGPDSTWREPWRERWIGASCHDAAELALAQRLGIDYVSLSPLCQTASHPQHPPLGLARFKALVQAAALPVFALGGVGPADVAAVRAAGGQGIAAIGAFWG